LTLASRVHKQIDSANKNTNLLLLLTSFLGLKDSLTLEYNRVDKIVFPNSYYYLGCSGWGCVSDEDSGVAGFSSDFSSLLIGFSISGDTSSTGLDS